MKARIIESQDGVVQVLCMNGTIRNCADQVLAKLVTKFNSEEYLSELSGEDGNWKHSSADMHEYAGKTLAYVSDDLKLVIAEQGLLASMVSSSYMPVEADTTTNYITLPEYAKLHKRAPSMIRQLCKKEKIAGAKKSGRFWLIPADAPYPIAPKDRKR